MGKEATCHCRWGNQAAQCKVLLESSELIVRAPISRRISTAALSGVSVHGENLQFNAGEETVTLAIGAAQAQSWAKKISTPPPTLASKLGISNKTRLAVIGECEAEELTTAITQSLVAADNFADLVLAMVKTVSHLNHALDRYAAFPNHPPIWIVYPKGPGKPINETEIRNTLRHEGFMDTKVASVSSALTALRFNKRS